MDVPRIEKLLKKPDKKGRRRKDQFSDTVKELIGYEAAHHLGHKSKHDADVAAQREWSLARKARKLGISVEDLDDRKPVEEELHKIHMPGDRSDDARVGGEISTTDELNRLLGRSGLILSMAVLGTPGVREWNDLEGAEWASQMMEYRKERRHYINASRHHVGKEGKRPLEIMLARLTPWVALEAVENLMDDPGLLRTKVKTFCKNFSDRYNVDALGAVLHRESAHDLHIHLIYSRTREVVIPIKATERQKARRRSIACDAIRMELRDAGKRFDNVSVSAILKERLLEGKIEPLDRGTFIVENRRYDTGETSTSIKAEEPPIVRRRCLHHAFRSKFQIWRAAELEDKDAVAAQKDRNPLDPASFRGGLGPVNTN